MSKLDDARLMLTKCRTCLGCNRLEIEGFRGDDKCINHVAVKAKEPMTAE